MLYDFKVSDSSKHVWYMSITNSKSCHCIAVMSPKGAYYRFVWRNGELSEVYARRKIYRADGKFFTISSSFREVFSLIPMWILDKINFYYKVHIA